MRTSSNKIISATAEEVSILPTRFTAEALAWFRTEYDARTGCRFTGEWLQTPHRGPSGEIAKLPQPQAKALGWWLIVDDQPIPIKAAVRALDSYRAEIERSGREGVGGFTPPMAQDRLFVPLMAEGGGRFRVEHRRTLPVEVLPQESPALEASSDSKTRALVQVIQDHQMPISVSDIVKKLQEQGGAAQYNQSYTLLNAKTSGAVRVLGRPAVFGLLEWYAPIEVLRRAAAQAAGGDTDPRGLPRDVDKVLQLLEDSEDLDEAAVELARVLQPGALGDDECQMLRDLVLRIDLELRGWSPSAVLAAALSQDSSNAGRTWQAAVPAASDPSKTASGAQSCDSILPGLADRIGALEIDIQRGQKEDEELGVRLNNTEIELLKIIDEARTSVRIEVESQLESAKERLTSHANDLPGKVLTKIFLVVIAAFVIGFVTNIYFEQFKARERAVGVIEMQGKLGQVTPASTAATEPVR